MLVVSFAIEGRNNCATVGDKMYVYARTKRGSFVLPAQCRHRGGPVHLAEWGESSSGKEHLVCPWHGNKVPVEILAKTAVPSARKEHVVTAIFSVPADTPYKLEHLPLSTCLSTEDTLRRSDVACK